MRGSSKTMKKIRHSFECAAVLCTTAALTLGVLTACAPQENTVTAPQESTPVVTSDDLTPPTAAQDAIAQEAGNGTNYAYEWVGENVEERFQQLQQECDAYVAQLQELIANNDEAALQQAGFRTVEEVQGMLEMLQEDLSEEALNATKESWQAEAALDPVISAQEAANLAGTVFETLYGVDLSDKALQLTCFESDSNMTYHPAGGGVMRTIWRVSREEDNDGVLMSTSSISCTLDATTGEFIAVDYYPSAEQYVAMAQAEVPACFVQQSDSDAAGSYGYWDDTQESYAPMVESLKEKVQNAVSGSALVGGAQITSIEASLTERTSENPSNRMYFVVECDNGNTYLFKQSFSYAQPCANYDFDGHPICAYRFENDTYLQGA